MFTTCLLCPTLFLNPFLVMIYLIFMVTEIMQLSGRRVGTWTHGLKRCSLLQSLQGWSEVKRRAVVWLRFSALGGFPCFQAHCSRFLEVSLKKESHPSVCLLPQFLLWLHYFTLVSHFPSSKIKELDQSGAFQYPGHPAQLQSGWLHVQHGSCLAPAWILFEKRDSFAPKATELGTFKVSEPWDPSGWQ